MTLSTTKKKLNDYTFEDLKNFFYNLARKISSKIVLIEIGNDFFNIAIAKCENKQLLIKKIYRYQKYSHKNLITNLGK